MVDGPGGGAAGGDDDVGGGGGDGLVQRRRRRRRAGGGGDLGAERAQPGRRAWGPARRGSGRRAAARREQLVAEDQDLHAGPGYGGQLVVSGGRGETEHGGGDQGAGGQQLVAGAALLAARADVLAVARRSPRGVQRAPLLVTRPCSLRITAVASGGMRAPVAIRTASPSASGCGPRWPGEARRRSARTRQGPGPATAQPSMAEVSKDGQVGQGGQGRGQRVAERLVERQAPGAGGPAAARRRRAGVARGRRPGSLGGGGRRGRGCPGGAAAPAGGASGAGAARSGASRRRPPGASGPRRRRRRAGRPAGARAAVR